MGFLKKTTGDTLKRRAHLGVVTNAAQVLQAAKDLGIQTCPLDIYALSVALGVMVMEVELPSDVSGSLKKQNGIWICTVNKNHHHTRRRFTVAHELGHFLMHKDDKAEFEDVVRNRAECDYTPDEVKMENEANRFASELLMPEKEFKAALLLKPLHVVAEEFDVSPIAAEVRAKLLGANPWS